MRLLSLEEQKEIESKINSYKSMNIKNINESEYSFSKLNLALALLYIEINNMEKFKLNIKEYMKKRNILNINPFAIVIIENRYNINLNKIIEDFKLR